jgi:hypothetical protein
MKLTPKHGINAHAVETMFSKAMCAYANWQECADMNYYDYRFRNASQYEQCAALEAEYQATARCIALFVEEHLPSVCLAIKDACKEEFGIG